MPDATVTTHYLIAGASHAALAALHAIRLVDEERPLTVIAKDDSLPYSPTVLPYVVSGRSAPASVLLRDERYFVDHKVQYLRGRHVTAVDTAERVATLSDGVRVRFEKLLLATGARPALPPIPGLADFPYHVLRTLADAERLHESLAHATHAVVLGGGLIGMHAAENLRKAGARVTIIEMQAHVLPAYFDATAAALIARAFVTAGVAIRTGARVEQIIPAGRECAVVLADGTRVTADLLLVGAGVVPVTDCLGGAAIATDRGVLVDDQMRTSDPCVWAAGDVAQARDFYGTAPVVGGIVPDAVEQGRIAGMAMADDPAVKPYRGAVPINTYGYFGNHAVAVGSQVAPSGAEVVIRDESAANRYLKIILHEDRLHGIFGINVPFDAGVMWELILRRVDLGPVRARFLAEPQDAARALMSRLWR
jgi:phenylglyoxylate dehydrogenase epsilon subunit